MNKSVSQLTWRSGSSRAIAAACLLRKACQRSQSCCKPSQKSADIPNTCASRNAVSGVTRRLPRIISFNRGKEIPSRTAKADWLIPRGLRNSSRSISPGCVGGRLAGSLRATSDCAGLPWWERGLVIVRDLNFVCIIVLPAKTHAILLVDANTVLAAATPPQPFKTIAGWDREVRKIANTVELVKPAASGRPQ